MAKEICISTTPHETRLAILEDEQLAEIYYERENEYTLAGSIYKGRVTRVLPGMQSSFVDVGLERDAFLYVTDFLEEQEDAEEFGGESSRRPRSAAGAAAGPGDEPEAERNGAERGDRTDRPDRGSRGEGRNGDRGRRASSQPQASEPARDAARESGRASRERVREQTIAPLREAVPAAQDLEEKGDEESPAGTRRWRGRRGRRRGVRSGLADPGQAPRVSASAEPQTGSPASSQGLEEFFEEDFAQEQEANASPTPERGAPGGIASLHASPASTDEALSRSESQQAARPDAARDRGGRTGRDRSSRRSREPYAQASTLDHHGADPVSPESASADRSGAGLPPSYSLPQGGPARSEAQLSSGGAIVLPGESLSKYGSAPAAEAAVAPSATVPRAASRPVNYVAPKPSTLVELSSDWDGGAVLPGETLSRYRETPAQPPALSSIAASQPSPVIEIEDDLHADQAAAPSPEQGISVAASSDAVPLAEPELVSEALSPASEQGEAQVAQPIFAAHEQTPEKADELGESSLVPAPAEAHHHLDHAPLHDAHPTESVHADDHHAHQPPEYEPENASASYRVDPSAPRELRFASPEAVEEPAPASQDDLHPDLPAHTHPDPAGHPDPSTVVEASAAAGAPVLAEPEGEFTDTPVHSSPADVEPTQPVHADFAEVPEFAGELLPAQALHEAPVHSAEHALSVLHEDGTIEAVSDADHIPVTHPEGASPEQAHPAPEPFEAHGFDFESGSPTHAHGHEDPDSPAATPSSLTPFSDLVDQLQGFSSETGTFEEEVIDEEEYDFEPMHAHADHEGDHEDLEEETLDHHLEYSTLSDAVRDSRLEQRVHHQPEAAVIEEASEIEEADSPFGFVEVDEDEDESEIEGDELAQPGESPSGGGDEARSGDGRSRGRDGRDGRSGRGAGGRNSGRRNGPGRGRSAQTQDLPIISDMLKQGQEILVQIAKEPIAKKGARITSHIALPGRFLVFMPTVSHVGVSRKIASDEERQRLKRILISEKGDSSGGFIVRTAAEGASEEDLRADLRFLISLWTEIKQRSDSAKAPALIYHDLNLIERILRDQVSSNFSTIWVDSEAEYERIIRFLNRFQPNLVRRVKLYTKETPLFEHFGIQEEISKALKSKVWLKSGGSIVINQTEALVAIDINTGKYVGKTARLEDTIVKTNLDAIPEIVRQIRLRDLGGIIVIDFIDMDERKNRNRVLAALEEELKHDRAPSKVLQFNDFGLVAITRKRVKQSLERTLSVTCETCTGTGMVKSPVTVCNEIYIEMRKMIKHLDGKDVMLRVHPEVVKQLKAGNGKWINELEEMVTKTIIIKSDPALHPEQFDIH